MYNNLAIASPVSIAVSIPSGSTDLQVMQGYIANGIAIFNQDNPVQPYEQYANQKRDLDLSYFEGTSYIKPVKALPAPGAPIEDKYNYYYEERYPSLFSCGIGIENILEQFGVEKSSVTLFGNPDIQLDIIKKLILRRTSVAGLESLVKELNDYLDATYPVNSMIKEKDCGQMHWLIQSALAQKDSLGLRVGVPLPESKYGLITKPFVWLVYEEYEGVTVLAPVIYFNKATLQSSPGRMGSYIGGDGAVLAI